MPRTILGPFPPDALEVNRRGELSDAQRRGFGALAWDRRKSAMSSAAFLVAGGLLIAFFASPGASPVARTVIPIIALAIAAFLVVRAVTGGDALTRDLRDVHVQSVEGAIGKRRFSAGSGASRANLYLDVGDRTFSVARATYDAAPDAGHVRLFFLPHSRKVVNLERLPNPQPTGELTPQGVFATLREGLASPGKRERNEARASLAGMAEAIEANFARAPAAPPPHERDPRPLEQAIVGTWSNMMMKLTFSAGGALTTHMLGKERDGRWSVDAAGRLSADITGHQQTADAWVAGNRLTIAAEGEGLVFTRESDA